MGRSSVFCPPAFSGPQSATRLFLAPGDTIGGSLLVHSWGKNGLRPIIMQKPEKSALLQSRERKGGEIVLHVAVL